MEEEKKQETMYVEVPVSPENQLRNITDLRSETLAIGSAAKEILDRLRSIESNLEIQEAILNYQVQNPAPSAANAQTLSLPVRPISLDTQTEDAQQCLRDLVPHPLDRHSLEQFLIEVKGKSANFRPVVEKFTSDFRGLRKQLKLLKEALQLRQAQYGKKKGSPKRMFDDTLLKRLKLTIIPDLDDLID